MLFPFTIPSNGRLIAFKRLREFNHAVYQSIETNKQFLRNIFNLR